MIVFAILFFLINHFFEFSFSYKLKTLVSNIREYLFDKWRGRSPLHLLIMLRCPPIFHYNDLCIAATCSTRPAPTLFGSLDGAKPVYNGHYLHITTTFDNSFEWPSLTVSTVLLLISVTTYILRPFLLCNCHYL